MKSCGCTGALPCGCCAGVEPVTPEFEVNRPGLTALRYRAGTFATFLETMQANLSRDRRLDGLATREPSDPSIALLDAWATVGDVLTFYQERIANEGYLATATERRSLVELGNLIGYRPRPGVSASVYLAYTLESGAAGTVAAGSLVRSVPAPGETQQAFETSEDLIADAAWNNLQVRLTRPATRKAILADRAVFLKGVVATIQKGDPLFVQFGTGNVALCRVVSVDPDSAAGRTRVGLEEWTAVGAFRPDAAATLADQLRAFVRIEDFGLNAANATVKAVLPVLKKLVSDLDAGSVSSLSAGIEAIRTLALESPPRSSKAREWVEAIFDVNREGTVSAPSPDVVTVDDLTGSQTGLLTAPSLSPRSQYHRAVDVQALFDANLPKTASAATRVPGATLATLIAFRPAFRATLASALANASVTADSPIAVFSVTRTAPFGNNAGPRATTTNGTTITTTFGEWPLDPDQDTSANVAGAGSPILDKIDLEKEFDKITSDTLIALQDGSGNYSIPPFSTDSRRPAVSTVSRAAYGLSGKVTRLQFAGSVLTNGSTNLGLLRPVKVFVAGESLPLAEQPVTSPVCGSDAEIELDALYEGLTPGRWIIIDGERQDTNGTSGVRATELLLIGDVQHRADPTLPGDRIHTFLRTAVPSSYCYRRDTLKIFGNIVKATNGETRKEVLGSGDAAVPFQPFVLKQPPLTYLAAATASGSDSTLKVYVNDVEWHEVDTPLGLPPYARNFFTRTADDGTTTVLFGDGVNGSRVPTGAANVRAAYRNGIGKAGNVQAGQLTILGSKSGGVKEVVNPLRASGGADKDGRDRVRENAPLSVMALDRLVSVADYEHFARTFAGIGKASSVALTDGRRQLVHVTIAGIDDVPIDPSSDLYLNLRHALHLLGDAHQALQLDVRFAKFLVLQAGVKLLPDYQWEIVAPRITAALTDAFSFDRRRLGQSAYLSQVVDVMQRVAGVEFVDPNRFGSIAEDQLSPGGIRQAITALALDSLVTAQLAASGTAGITPAEIAYFAPDVPATIALNQL